MYCVTGILGLCIIANQLYSCCIRKYLEVKWPNNTGDKIISAGDHIRNSKCKQTTRLARATTDHGFDLPGLVSVAGACAVKKSTRTITV